jgi:hypothetical protein
MEVIVSHHSSFIGFAFVTVVVVMSVLTGSGQDITDQWLRVFTEGESIIDVNRSSLVLEQNQVISAQFRTKLLKPEQAPGRPDIKYQTRLDSIQFSIKDRRYRISESSLLDASGNVVLSYSSSGTNGWKPRWGRTGNRLFNAASQLQPFGNWKVISYRYASGEPASDQDPPELRSLVGSELLFKLDRVVVGRETCTAPMIDAKTVTDDEFVRRVGSSLKSLGITSDKVDAIYFACRTKSDFPTLSFILRMPGNKALMLWDGVFLEIERPPNLFVP